MCLLLPESSANRGSAAPAQALSSTASSQSDSLSDFVQIPKMPCLSASLIGSLRWGDLCPESSQVAHPFGESTGAQSTWCQAAGEAAIVGVQGRLSCCQLLARNDSAVYSIHSIDQVVRLVHDHHCTLQIHPKGLPCLLEQSRRTLRCCLEDILSTQGLESGSIR